jgi:hypothetical protein
MWKRCWPNRAPPFLPARDGNRSPAPSRTLVGDPAPLRRSRRRSRRRTVSAPPGGSLGNGDFGGSGSAPGRWRQWPATSASTTSIRDGVVPLLLPGGSRGGVRSRSLLEQRRAAVGARHAEGALATVVSQRSVSAYTWLRWPAQVQRMSRWKRPSRAERWLFSW